MSYKIKPYGDFPIIIIYFDNSVMSRSDGPAIVWENGIIIYHLMGVELDENKHYQGIKK